jgi:transcription initiation factor TFIID subunit TAF12
MQTQNPKDKIDFPSPCPIYASESFQPHIPLSRKINLNTPSMLIYKANRDKIIGQRAACLMVCGAEHVT